MVVSDADVLASVERAIRDGGRDAGGGGVHPETVAEYSPLKAVTLRGRCRELSRSGDLVRMEGLGPGFRPRLSFLPVGHEDAPEREEKGGLSSVETIGF